MLKRSDARVIVATNRDLRGLQASGQFRKDLNNRLQRSPPGEEPSG